jgi:DUF1365 family protein
VSFRSGIYEGVVHHRRYTPIEHSFRFRMFMMYLDLGELDGVFSGSWLWSTSRRAPAWFRRADYLGSRDVPLDEAVRDRAEAETGNRPLGPIRLLTHLRYFGYIFNPVSFYYCFDRDDARVETVVAEITNTPWKERHSYVLQSTGNAESDRVDTFRFAKDFHVSPFMPMDLSYTWTFGVPDDHLSVEMSLLDRRGLTFDSSMSLQRLEITPKRLRRLLVRYPMMTARVTARIHWEALRLWLKGCPVHTHPRALARGTQT